MELLDYFQNRPPENTNYIQRKLQFPASNRIHLYGVRGAGKSALVADYLSELYPETLLYIDFEDPNLTFGSISSSVLQEYIDTHQIETLVLDHYETGFLEVLPHVEQMIVISRSPLPLEGFSAIELFPLDYEEFLAFEKASSQTASFNRFLKVGTLPLMAASYKTGTPELKNFLYSKFEKQDIHLLIVLASYQTRHLSTHQIYTAAKERFKVSKDWLYRKIKQFRDEGILYFIDDVYQKGGKKLILFDFAVAKYLSMGQPFINQFDTMIALALLKHHRSFKTLGIHGYLTSRGELIIPAPFESEESVWKKSHGKFSLYKKYGVKRVTVVTVANAYNYRIEQIAFEALPFYEWSILNENEESDE